MGKKRVSGRSSPGYTALWICVILFRRSGGIVRRLRHLFKCLIILLLFCGGLGAHPSRAQDPQTKPPGEDVNNLIKRAEIFLARKLYDDALDAYKQCIVLAPRDATLYNRIGVVYHRKQDLKRAEENYKRAVKLNPNYAEAQNNLGTIAYTHKKYRRAINFYNKAVKLRPDMATMRYNLGGALFALERYDQAFQEYQTAFTLDPELLEHLSATGSVVRTATLNRAKFHFFLAKIYAAQGSNDRALENLTRALEEGFKDLDTLYADKDFAALIKDEKFVRLMQNPPKPIE